MKCDHETQTPVAFTSPSKFLQPELTDHTSKHFYFYRVHQLYVIQNKFLGSSALHLLKIRPLNLDLILVTRSCNSIATGSYRLNWRYKTLFRCHRFQNHKCTTLNPSQHCLQCIQNKFTDQTHGFIPKILIKLIRVNFPGNCLTT